MAEPVSSEGVDAASVLRRAEAYVGYAIDRHDGWVAALLAAVPDAPHGVVLTPDGRLSAWEPPTLTDEVVAEALEVAWGEWVSDTGCFPDCITVEKGRGVVLSADFRRGNFASYVAGWLNRRRAEDLLAIIDRLAPPPVQQEDDQ